MTGKFYEPRGLLLSMQVALSLTALLATFPMALANASATICYQIVQSLAAVLQFVGLRSKRFAGERSGIFLIALWLTTIAFYIACDLGIALLMYLNGLMLILFFVDLLFNFFRDYFRNCQATRLFPGEDWQLIFIRMFIGLDLIPHFGEKLLMGASVRVDDVRAFATLGLPDPLHWVLLAGSLECASSFAFTTGFMTRIGAIGFAVYLFISSLLGGHFHNGFIWAGKGGGWEFPIFWSVISVMFALYGAVGLSLDNTLKRCFHLPKWLRLLMGGTH